jgi:peptide/nickel transport system permease protein
MGQAVLTRALLVIPILFGMSVVVFAIIRLVPGDPVVAVLGLNATPQLIAQTRHQLGLDQPVWLQYLQWLGGILHGDFGRDYRGGHPISQLLAQTLPVTFELVVLSMLIAVVAGVALGTASAVWRGRVPDRIGQVISTLGISVPDFWLGMILILALALLLGLFPSSGFTPLPDDPLDNLWHMLLPALALAAGLTAVLIRITRAAMLDVLDQDFLRAARSRGLPERAVVLGHGLRNAAVPIVTVIGMQSGYLFGATVVIENVFSIPGLGRLILDSTLAHNYPVIQASVLVLGAVFVLTNLLVDVVYMAIDPRVARSTGGAG